MYVEFIRWINERPKKLCTTPKTEDKQKQTKKAILASVFFTFKFTTFLSKSRVTLQNNNKQIKET